MAYKLSIVEQIEILQKRKSVSNDELAKLLHVTPQNILRRKRLNSFSSSELELIAEHLGFSIEFIPS